MKKQLIALSLLPLVCSLSSCGEESEFAFKYWNEDSESFKALKAFVEGATKKGSDTFIPVEDRIATFDMDGTFVAELYPTYFEYNMLEYRALDDPDYKDKAPEDVRRAGNDIRAFVRNGVPLPANFDVIHARAAAKAYAGMTLEEFDAYVKRYADKAANGFTGMTYGQGFYQPMLEVFEYLEKNDFTYYVVSGSDRFICRSLVSSIGIPENRVIGMDVTLKANHQGDKDGLDYVFATSDELVRTDELIIKNLKTNKVKLIAQEIGKQPVLSFGNSGGDTAMHNYALSNPNYKGEAFMLIADDDVRDHANREKALKLGEEWKADNYHVISMRDDFKTIYQEGAAKTDFVYDDAPTLKEVDYDSFHQAAENAVKGDYKTATITVRIAETVRYSDGSQEETIERKELTFTASYSENLSLWTIDDPDYALYALAINSNASYIDNDFGSSSYYNVSADAHFYAGEGFRYTAKGSRKTDETHQESVDSFTSFENTGNITYDRAIKTSVDGTKTTIFDQTMTIAYQ